MSAWLLPLGLREPSTGNRRARLWLESLEPRDCPSTAGVPDLVLVDTPSPLILELENTQAAPVAPVILVAAATESSGADPQTLLTAPATSLDNTGGLSAEPVMPSAEAFMVDTYSAELGEEIAQTSETESALMLEEGDEEQQGLLLGDFSALLGPNDSWILTGFVSNMDPAAMTVVEFGGLLEGEFALVDPATGMFMYATHLTPSAFGAITAQACDSNGNESDVVTVLIEPLW